VLRASPSLKHYPATLNRRVPQVSLVLRDLGVATPAESIMCIALFLPHFGSPVVHVVLAQVSQLRRDLGHPGKVSGNCI